MEFEPGGSIGLNAVKCDFSACVGQPMRLSSRVWALLPDQCALAGLGNLGPSFVDRLVSASQIPSLSAASPASAARPAVLLNNVDFWVQGVHFGVELDF